jgi:hypothetical protein
MRKSTPQPSIQLHIEELVLHGFAPADRYHIADAVQGELVRLFTEQGVSIALRQGGRATRLNAGSFNVAPAMRAETIGRHVAQSVYQSLNPHPKP